MARRAIPDDAPQLIRLRAVMLAAVSRPPRPVTVDDTWARRAEQTLRVRLAEPAGSLTALVVDDPDGSGRLLASAMGVIENRLGSPANPGGQVGYVFSVATDPAHRRRGYSTACMRGLLAWFAERGVSVVDLRTSAEAEPLYRSLGFVRTPEPAMRLVLPIDT
jgi:GNAT superfamily N-acetyltransferase